MCPLIHISNPYKDGAGFNRYFRDSSTGDSRACATCPGHLQFTLVTSQRSHPFCAFQTHETWELHSLWAQPGVQGMATTSVLTLQGTHPAQTGLTLAVVLSQREQTCECYLSAWEAVTVNQVYEENSRPSENYKRRNLLPQVESCWWQGKEKGTKRRMKGVRWEAREEGGRK